VFSAKYDRTRNCILMFLGTETWLTPFGLRRFSALLRPAGREDAVGKERVISPSMPAPFSAIRDTAASRRRALGAMSSASRNGRGIDVHPCWSTAGEAGTPERAATFPEVPAPPGAPLHRAPRTMLSTNAKKVTVSVLYWYE
jgi:hypothetical protein